jgi:subtilisin family serine protease
VGSSRNSRFANRGEMKSQHLLRDSQVCGFGQPVDAVADQTPARRLPRALALSLTLLAPYAVHPAIPPQQRPATANGSTASPLHVSGDGRSARQQLGIRGAKLDPALAELTTHLNLVTPQNAVADLHSLNPAAKFMQRPSDATPLVLVDAITRGDPQQLKSALVALGLQNPSVYSNDVSGWLPVTQIEAATARGELHSMRAAMSRTRSGAVTSQGDFAQRSDVLRSTYPTLDGTGVTVGALSDSYNCYPTYAQNHVSNYARNGFTATAATDVASGDLPSGVNVLSDVTCTNYDPALQLPFGDEGRAMLQIVHDVAPGASLAFYTAENGEGGFAGGITALQSNAHANVIVDDVGYFDEPFFQDGMVAQAIDAVVAKGVAYFSAAGNDGSNAYDNTAPSFSKLSTSAPNAGEYLLNFDNSGATTVYSLSIDIPPLTPGELVALVLQWDQPYVTGASGSPGASSHLDLCVTGSGSDKIINLSGTAVACTGANGTGVDPVHVMIVSNPANAAGPTALETINVAIGLADGTAAPGRIKLAVEGGGLAITIHSNYAANPALQGHPGAAGAAAVGAAAFYKTPGCGVTTAVLEAYSAQGGSPILFDTSGTRLATPVVRQKPNFVGPDGGNDTFLGFKIAAGRDTSTVAQCANNASYPNFFGTSAASPHAAAIAALMLQANSNLTPAQIYGALQKTALPMGTVTPDFNSGYGFIQADAAMATLPPGAPTLTLASSSVAPGATTTLKWSSINTTSCTASGAWTGSQAISGSTTITAPATAGTVSYTLTCTNANGTASGTANLTVAAPSSGGGGGGGGGAMDEIALLILGSLGVVRLIRGTHLWAPARPRCRRSCRATTAARYQWRSTGIPDPQ